MNEPLHPSNLGEILDRTANLYRSRFLVFFGIAVIPAGMVLIFASGVFLLLAWTSTTEGAPLPPGRAGTIAVAALAGAMLVALPISAVVVAFGSTALNHAVARAHISDIIAIRSSYKGAWENGWRYIWLYALRSAIQLLAPMFVWGLCFFAAAIAGALGWGAVVGASPDTLLNTVAIAGSAGFIGYFIWMLLRLSLAFPACVVEQMPAWAAVRRSTQLSKGTRGRLLLLYLLGAVLTCLLALGVAVPVMILVELIPGANSPQYAQTMGMAMVFIPVCSFFAVQALTRPVYGIALMLLYYDQRIRQEGFDIEWMMQQAGLVASRSPTPEATPSPAPTSNPQPPRSGDLP